MMQSHFDSSSIKIAIIIVLAVYFVLCATLQYVFVHWIPVCIFLTIFGIYILIRAIGTFLMYPGAFRFTQSDLQIREGQALCENNHEILTSLYQICERVGELNLSQAQDMSTFIGNRKLKQSILTQINVNINLLKQAKKTKRKDKLYRLYLKLQQNITQKFCQQLSLSQLIDNHLNLNKLSESNYFELTERTNSILVNLQQIWKISQQLVNPDINDKHKRKRNVNNQVIRKAQAAKWFLQGQKLVDLSSFYGYWDMNLNYNRFFVPIQQNKYKLQCAVIHSKKYHAQQIEQSESQKNNKSVIFCIPNAMYLQNTALQSSQIDFYLDLGFKVVIWNYRGYGQSTGNISLYHCTKDIIAVYQYCERKLKIDIVIAHGYSIGGACATELGYAYPKKIKLVVSDRSFSSIDQVAKAFVPKNNFIMRWLNNSAKCIVKTFFTSQCIDISEKFLKLGCKKVIIWDQYDQIIKNEASVKEGIFSNLITKPYSRNRLYDKNDVGDQLQQLVTMEVLNKSEVDQLNHNYHKFINNMMDLMTFKVELYSEIIDILKDIDGAGIYINRHITHKPTLKQNLSSFFLGLVCYSSKIINKAQIQYKISFLQSKSNQNTKKMKDTPKNEKDNILQTLRYALEIYQKGNLRDIVGRLIITDIGHNGSMNKRQFRQLKTVISQALNPHNAQSTIN